MSNGEPDSDFIPGIGDDRKIEIAWTAPGDFPSSGAVTIRLHFSRFQSVTIKIKRSEAESAYQQLGELLGYSGTSTGPLS